VARLTVTSKGGRPSSNRRYSRKDRNHLAPVGVDSLDGQPGMPAVRCRTGRQGCLRYVAGGAGRDACGTLPEGQAGVPAVRCRRGRQGCLRYENATAYRASVSKWLPEPLITRGRARRSGESGTPQEHGRLTCKSIFYSMLGTCWSMKHERNFRGLGRYPSEVQCLQN